LRKFKRFDSHVSYFSAVAVGGLKLKRNCGLPLVQLLTLQLTISPVVRLEAESQQLAGGSVTATLHAGYTGNGYVDGQGSAVTFTTTRNTAGAARLTFRYINGSTVGRPIQIFVNNSLVGTLSFAPTGGWSVWKTVSLDGVQLPTGNVTIKAVASTSVGGPDLDSLSIV
jgi:hypothetical protein